MKSIAMPLMSLQLGRRHVLLAAAGLALTSGPAAAEIGVDEATKFIDAITKQLMETVNGPAEAAAKSQKLEAIIEAHVDIEAVARFCLGRFWRGATPQQQKSYLDLFHRVLVNNITGRVGEYQGVTIVTNRAAARESDVAVTTTVTRPNNAPNRVDWLVSAESGKPKVIDVIAEGTSLRLTQRNDYLSYLSHNNNDLQALIDALRQQAGK
jgi:phospholipid transport system substrate-binding protein